MDVASALRREREVAVRELAIDETRARLRQRLRAAADESGDPVTDAEIEVAIDHYFESQFEFAAPRRGWRVLVAHAWVRRRAITASLLVVATLSLGIWRLFLSESAPLSGAARQARAVASAWETVPGVLTRARTLAADDPARAEVESLAGELEAVHARGNIAGIQSGAARLASLLARLADEYVVRVVSRPGERSGMDAYYEDAHGSRISGYYLIVEQIGQSRPRQRAVFDAELQAERRVRKWGEQVPKAVYDRIAADKQADGIVDDAIFARKERGHLDEVIVMTGPDGSTPLPRGRQITKDL